MPSKKVLKKRLVVSLFNDLRLFEVYEYYATYHIYAFAKLYIKNFLFLFVFFKTRVFYIENSDESLDSVGCRVNKNLTLLGVKGRSLRLPARHHTRGSI